MKVNQDCVRDILLMSEKYLTDKNMINADAFMSLDETKKYSADNLTPFFKFNFI